MSDVLYRVRTVYETDTKKSAGEMLSLSTAAGGVSGALSVVGGVARTALTGALVGGIAAGVLGLAGLVEGVNHLNGAMDSTAVSIAGMVAAFGVEGTEGPLGWSSSMAFAEGAMAQIRRDAAALPGEADQFVEVFRAGLPGALEAGMQSADIAGFTNRFAAVGISFGVDAEQIGRDLNLILQGRAGAHVNMWNRLKSLVGKTAEEFNKLTAVQRQALIDTALRRYQPMIDAYANTWDAITSTTASYGKDLLRVATNPFFMVAKKELRTLNDWWGLNEKGIREYANGLGTEVVNAYKNARHAAERYFHRVDEFVRTGAIDRALTAGGHAWDTASGMASRAWGAMTANPAATASTAGMAAGAAMGVPGLGLALGAVAKFAEHTDAASVTLGNLWTIVGAVTGAAEPLWHVFDAVETTLGSFLAGVLPGLSTGVSSVIVALEDVTKELGPAVGDLLGALEPIVSGVGTILGEVAEAAGAVLAPALRAAAGAAASFLHVVAEKTRGWTDRGSALDRLWRGGNNPWAGREVWSRVYAGARAFDDSLMNDLGLRRANGSMESLYDRYRGDYMRWAGLTPRAPAQAPAPPNPEQQRANGIMERMHEALERIRQPLTAERRAALGSARGLAGHTAGHPGRTAVNVTINQTVHTNDDADRILVLTRRAVDQGVHAPLQTPGVRVTH